ncbi:MAG: hypothetical protein EOP50_07910 [Sphingobacteriales bacterium]|nr:MAG: hypothetical protein EOP50_07910 [Sphingobacteriales bacterium]
MRNEGEKQENQRLPDDVRNAAQDPASMKDPLQQQLEKSEGLNGPQEQRTLDQLEKDYGKDGTAGA